MMLATNFRNLDNERDIVVATITDEETGEAISIGFCESLLTVIAYVTKFTENLFITKEFKGKLLQINNTDKTNNENGSDTLFMSNTKETI